MQPGNTWTNLLQILLGIVAGGAVSAGLPQYRPPRSPQQYYKPPPPVLDAARPVQDHKPMYTYAEVNTPYYQYHYYSPVYKNYNNQPPLFEAPLPESAIRNDVSPYANGASTMKNLFYPSTTSISSSPSDYGYRNNGHEPRMELFSPAFNNAKEVHITSKPINVNNAFAPMFRSYQSPNSNQIHPSPVTSVSNPTELASGFPNIFRGRHGNDRNTENLLTYQATTLKPVIVHPATANRNLFNKPIVVPESLAKPSTTIIKEEVRRRGISPMLEFRGQYPSPTNKPSLEKSPLNTDTFTSTSSLQFSTPREKSSEPVITDGGISANILRVFSSPNLELTQNYTFNTSAVLPTEIVFNDESKEDVSKPSDSFNHSSSQVTTQISSDTTTVSHRQKIAKKVNPTVVPKKFLPKHPNVLFYSPGHDIPN